MPERLSRHLSLLLLPIAVLVIGYGVRGVEETGNPAIAGSNLQAALALGSALILVAAIWTISNMRAEPILFPTCAMLLATGLVLMRRLQPDIGGSNSALGNLSGRHTVYVVLSLAVITFTARWFPFWPTLRRYKYLTVAGSIGLLLVTLVAGRERYGAKLWIGAGPVEIQTSEIIKIGLVMFLAAYLHEKHEVMNGRWTLWRLSLPPLPYLIPLASILVIALVMVVAMNDLGTALLLFASALSMLYVALRKIAYVIAGLAVFLAGATLAYVTFDRVGTRIQNWINPWNDPYVAGYQQIQADYAMSAGGLFGSGLGRGEPWRIPAVHTDYVFAVLIEEAGLITGLAVIGLYMVIALRGLHISARADSLYERYLAVGLTATLSIQAIVILGGVLRLMPLTGVTLPFVSAGGSSLLMNALVVGMLINLSHRQNAPDDRHA